MQRAIADLAPGRVPEREEIRVAPPSPAKEQLAIALLGVHPQEALQVGERGL